MYKTDILRGKSLNFAVRVYRLSTYLREEFDEYVISKQVLRSGTSIGANIAESKRAETPADFVHKMGIAEKECEETLFWLDLMERVDLINNVQHDSMHKDCEELLKILASSSVTVKKNLSRQ